MPPKITISETSTHHTARRPVGIPIALRVVAIVLALLTRMPSERCLRSTSSRRRGATSEAYRQILRSEERRSQRRNRTSRTSLGLFVLGPVILGPTRNAVFVGT